MWSAGRHARKPADARAYLCSDVVHLSIQLLPCCQAAWQPDLCDAPTSSRTACRAGKPSASKLGSFLVQSQLQTSVNSSAMFLTAAAQNLLCMKLAAELGVLVPSPWVTWFYAAAVPALIGILVTPFLMYQVGPESC